MSVRRRPVVMHTATLIVTGLLVTACSSDTASPESTTLAVGSTTTVAASTTSVADTTPDTTIATTTPTTAPPTTAAPPTTVPSSGTPLYQPVAAPTVPTTHTDPFAATGTLANGGYWVIYQGGEAATPAVTVMQAFFGDECVSKAAELGDECLNDIFVVGDPGRDIDDLPLASNAVITVADANTQQSYRITPAELVQIRAGSPSADAPDGFDFVPFPWLMTVQNGSIVKFEQVWTP